MADIDGCGDCVWCEAHLAEFPHKNGCPVPRAERAEAALAIAVEAMQVVAWCKPVREALTRINELRGTPGGGTGNPEASG